MVGVENFQAHAQRFLDPNTSMFECFKHSAALYNQWAVFLILHVNDHCRCILQSSQAMSRNYIWRRRSGIALRSRTRRNTLPSLTRTFAFFWQSYKDRRDPRSVPVAVPVSCNIKLALKPTIRVVIPKYRSAVILPKAFTRSCLAYRVARSLWMRSTGFATSCWRCWIGCHTLSLCSRTSPSCCGCRWSCCRWEGCRDKPTGYPRQSGWQGGGDSRRFSHLIVSPPLCLDLFDCGTMSRRQQEWRQKHGMAAKPGEGVAREYCWVQCC